MRQMTISMLRTCCREHDIEGYSRKNKEELGNMIFEAAQASEDSFESDEEKRDLASEDSFESDEEKRDLDYEEESGDSGQKRASLSTIEELPIPRPSKKRITSVLLFLQIKTGIVKQNEESNGQEKEKFEKFLKEAHLSEYIQKLCNDKYDLLRDLKNMEKEEIEKYFPTKPHRRRFEIAIKKIKDEDSGGSNTPEIGGKPVIDGKPVPKFARKFALIIGNGNYRMNPLGSNPVNDAQAIKKKFVEYGYKVFCHENLKKRRTLPIVFFAGHGIQLTTKNPKVPVENYLLDIDNNYTCEREITYEDLTTERIVKALEAADVDAKILLLDCCRNVSGLPRSILSKHCSLVGSGLKIDEKELRGCMTLYACQPGEEALNGDTQNGLFTQSLLESFENIRKDLRRKKRAEHPPRFLDLVNGAAKIMEERNQRPAVQIPDSQVIDICIDGTLFKDWF
eukprot:jgi/Bigna1/75866/fgenesh1_pg.37_\